MNTDMLSTKVVDGIAVVTLGSPQKMYFDLIGRLEDAIDETDCIAVILSENSVESEWVSREVRMALHREIS